MHNGSNILITRPLEQGLETQKALIAKGYKADCQPFLDVTYHKIRKDISYYKGLIFTSCHGVQAFCESYRLRDMSVFAVGDATAQTAEKAGFKNVQSASGTLDDLENLLAQNPPHGSLLYVRGKHISKEIKEEYIQEIIGYHTDLIDNICDDVEGKLRSGVYSYVLFYSTRTAASFVEMMISKNLSESLKGIKALCLAPSMVKSLSVLPWQDIWVAQQPNQDSLLELLDN